MVHRLAFELFYGYEPKLDVSHSCDNTKCFEPTHLSEKSTKENLRETAIRKRNPKQKLTVDDVLEIKRELAKGTSLSTLAKRYGTSSVAISFIKTGRTWSYVKD